MGIPIASVTHTALITARSCCTGAHTVVSTARTTVSTLLPGANTSHTALRTGHTTLRAAHSTLSTPQTGCTRAHTPSRAHSNSRPFWYIVSEIDLSSSSFLNETAIWFVREKNHFPFESGVLSYYCSNQIYFMRRRRRNGSNLSLLS